VDNFGYEVLIRADIGAVPAPLETTRMELPERPAQLSRSFPDGDVFVREPAPSSVKAGDAIEIGVTAAEIFLFDRAGRRITFIDTK
jgi:hypothetical protein